MSTLIKQALPWQDALWSDWLDQLEADRMPHAVLISGLAGLGKRHLALAFGQALLCAADSEPKPCGHCKSCELLNAGSHPDLRLLEPEEAGKAIKIAQIRSLMDFLSSTAQQGGWKCVIIEPADAMNTHAANALLKSLEEPPGDTLIILVSALPSRLGATVRSRCRQIPVKPPSREQALTWLQPQVGDRAAELLDYAHGAPLAALAASDDNKLIGRTEILESLLALAQGEGSTLDAAKRLQSADGPETMDQILAFLNEVAKAQLGLAAKAEVTTEPWRSIVIRVDVQLLFRFRDKLLHAKDLLLGTANPNKQLLWEEVMFDWQALTTARRHSRQASAR